MLSLKSFVKDVRGFFLSFGKSSSSSLQKLREIEINSLSIFVEKKKVEWEVERNLLHNSRLSCDVIKLKNTTERGFV